MLASLVCWAGDSSHETLAHWRQQKEIELRKPDGWLSLVGLEFLSPGEHKLTANKDGDLTAESSGTPLATLSVDANGVRLKDFAPDIRVNGNAPAKDVLLQINKDKLQYRNCTVIIIQRGDRYALRIRDTQSIRRKNFQGMVWYPASDHYRITADFLPSPAGTTIPVPTAIGTTLQLHTPGTVRFTIQGAQYTLTPVLETPDAKQLFFIFKDATASHTTYGAGRFLYTDLPQNGKVVLDFNRAENPPCAFTPYATCPRPPKGNVLSTAIKAGEKAPVNHEE
jgi:uncharacterized protein (DUF1684 family)